MEFDLTLGIAVLERTPPTLRAMRRGLGPAWADATEGPESRRSQGESLDNLLDEFARLHAANLTTRAGWRLTDTELAREGSGQRRSASL